MTREHGRLSGIGRGSRQRATGVMPWSRVSFEFAGRTDLLSIRGLERTGGTMYAPAASLWLMLLAEIILRFVPRGHADPELYRTCLVLTRADSEESVMNEISRVIPELAVNYARTDERQLRERLMALAENTGAFGNTEGLVDLIEKILNSAFPGQSLRTLQLLRNTTRMQSSGTSDRMA